MPQEWADKLKLRSDQIIDPVQIKIIEFTFDSVEENKSGDSKHGGLKRLTKVNFEISRPFHMEHVTQVTVDADSEHGLKGLP